MVFYIISTKPWPSDPRSGELYQTSLRHQLHMYAFCANLIFYHLCEHPSERKAMIYQGSVWSPLCLCQVAAGFVALWHSDHPKTKKLKENKKRLVWFQRDTTQMNINKRRVINIKSVTTMPMAMNIFYLFFFSLESHRFHFKAIFKDFKGKHTSCA